MADMKKTDISWAVVGDTEQEASGEPEKLPVIEFLDGGKLSFCKPSADEPTRLTVDGDRSYLKVTARAAFPLSDRNVHIELYGGDDKSIGMLRSLGELSGGQQDILRDELERRYFTPRITCIDLIKRETGMHRWMVGTDRGAMEFLVKSIREDVKLLGNGRYRIKDVDGRLYEVTDIAGLPTPSRRMLEELL